MIKVFLFLVLLCIQAACSSSRYSSEYSISHYLNASEDNEIAHWRKKLDIPMDALIAIYPDEHYVIVESNTRIREI